jgi:uncharacterized membrane protein YadS
MVKLLLTRMLALAGILAFLCTLVNASTSSSHLHHDQGSFSNPQFPVYVFKFERISIARHICLFSSYQHFVDDLIIDMSATEIQSQKI